MTRKWQRGLGMGGWIFLILIVGGATSLGMKLIPLYMDNNTVVNVLDALATESGMEQKTDAAIFDMIEQRLKVNSIRDWPIADRMEIKRSSRRTELVMDYEVRMPIFQNIDVIVSFNKSVELR